MKLKCSCVHLGHCLFQHASLASTFLDGTKVYRNLTAAEQQAGVFRRGDAAVRDARTGEVAPAFRAIDPDRVVRAAEDQEGRKCKAVSAMWRFRHPVPRADEQETDEQRVATEAACVREPAEA